MNDPLCPATCAVVVPLPQRTQIEMRGTDRAAFLHNLCTNDIKRLKPGQGCEAFITDVRGKTIGHVLAFVGTEELMIDTVPHQLETLLPHLDKYLITEDVQLNDVTSGTAQIALFGAESHKVLQFAGMTVPSNSYDHVTCQYDGHAVSIRRVPMTREPNFLLRTTTDGIEVITEAIIAAGAISADDTILEVARVEFGWPQFGQDITPNNFPQEINRDATAISFTKGCYLGQETVARIDALGHVNRLLVGLRFDAVRADMLQSRAMQSDGDRLPPIGGKLFVGDKEVGEITSVVFSRQKSAPLALGFVRSEHALPGSRIQWDGVAVDVVALPIGDVG